MNPSLPTFVRVSLAVATFAASAAAQLVIVPSTTSFTDILATGTNPGAASDDSELNVPSANLQSAGFAGNELLALANIRIGNNGAVLWNATTGDVGYVNSPSFLSMVPSAGVDANGGTMPGVQFVCPWWDDLFPLSGQTNFAQRWKVVGGNLYIQWSHEAHYTDQINGSIRFQMIVYGGRTIASGLPLVEFVYDDSFFGQQRYQNDGGSATIGFKNWGVVAAANDVEFGLGGGTGSGTTDPPYGDPTMHPKVAGWVESETGSLPKSLVIKGGASTPVVYCTAGTSTNGCVPAISASQQPSVSHANPCVISVANVEGQKSGLIFYGIDNSGFTPSPWASGSTSYLCVKAPTQRTITQSSGGTVGACDGSIALDLDAFLSANPGSLGQPFAAGAKAYAQTWYRDPPAAKTTNLSDAVELTFQP
jgi:hypothetical protein